MIYGVLGDQLVSPLSGQGEVVQAGDAEHGVVDAVAFTDLFVSSVGVVAV
ncbi:hypothetical protein J7E88_32745 [Streptomyces sp. ISL-10]|nr:hypothetical protein [Streptomyces sp. ISL-10]MBT2369916.1 hypothetical protein [Streptomyces sp. ISL-10]